MKFIKICRRADSFTPKKHPSCIFLLIAMFIIASYSAFADTRQDGMNVYLKMDNNTHNGSHIFSHNLTINFTHGRDIRVNRSGQINNSLYFNGTSQSFLEATNDKSKVTANYTIAGWVLLNSTSAGSYHTVIARDGTATNGYALYVADDNFIYCQNYDGTKAQRIKSDYRMTFDSWVFLACIQNDSGINSSKLYFINSTHTHLKWGYMNNTPYYSVAPLFVGSWREEVYPWHGFMDEIGLWNKTLSDGEIQTIMNYGLSEDAPPSYTSNTTNNSYPRLNDTIQFNITWIDDRNLSKSQFSWNCTDSDWKNFTDIDMANSVFNHIVFNTTLNYTSNIKDCSWKFYANDSLGNVSKTDEYSLIIDKIVPNATVIISPSPAESNEDLSCVISFSDIEEDDWISNQTIWFNNSEHIASLDNLTLIGSANTTIAETWTCMARVYDGYKWSAWKNDSLLIGDSTPPNYYNFETEYTAAYTDTPINVSINCTDADSPISNILFEFEKPSSSAINKTATFIPYLKSAIGWYDFDEIANIGLYNVTAYCIDLSGNTNVSSKINFTVSTRPESGGGGGGGGTIIVNETQPFNETGLVVLCRVNGICEPPNEDFYSCPEDCIFSVERDIFGYLNAADRRTFIIRMITLVTVLSLLYLAISRYSPNILKRWNLPVWKPKGGKKRRFF